MTELKKFFDQPCDEFIPSFSQPNVTNFPHVEDRIRETLDEFADCQGYVPRDHHRLSAWKAGARDFVDAHGERPALLRKAWKMYLDIPWERRPTIIIKTPRSLISFAQKVLDNESEKEKRDPDKPENRQRFLRGWWD